MTNPPRRYCDTLDPDGLTQGGAALAADKHLERVLFFPADAHSLTSELPEGPDTLIIHCRDLIFPNWHMITRDIGLKPVELNEASLLNAMLEMQRP